MYKDNEIFGIQKTFPKFGIPKNTSHNKTNLSTGHLFFPGKFKKYDYGILGNKNKYGTLNPPDYDLSKIKVPVSLYYSENDWLANVKVRISLHRAITSSTFHVIFSFDVLTLSLNFKVII